MDPYGRFDFSLLDKKSSKSAEDKPRPKSSIEALLGPRSSPGSGSSSSFSTPGPYLPTPTPEPDSTASRTRKSLHKGDLETFLRSLVDALNARNYILWQDAFDHNFRAILPPYKMTAAEYIAHLEMVAAIRPEAKIVILGMDTTVDEGRGQGRVFMEFEILRVLPGGITRQSVACVKFRICDDGKWRLARYEAQDNLRGMAGFDN